MQVPNGLTTFPWVEKSDFGTGLLTRFFPFLGLDKACPGMGCEVSFSIGVLTPFQEGESKALIFSAIADL